MRPTSPEYVGLTLIFYLFVGLIVWQVLMRFVEWYIHARVADADYTAGRLPPFNWIRFAAQLVIAFTLWAILYVPAPGAQIFGP